MSQDYPNPVVRETKLSAYPGWTVRKYRDGMYDATDGIGLTLGLPTFAEVVAEVRKEEASKKRHEAYRLEARRTFEAMSDAALAFQGARIVGGIDREELERELGRRAGGLS
jgi:hypothetical protein